MLIYNRRMSEMNSSCRELSQKGFCTNYILMAINETGREDLSKYVHNFCVLRDGDPWWYVSRVDVSDSVFLY